MRTIAFLARWFAAVTAAGAALRAAEPDADYSREMEAWRNARVTQLTKPDGWLTLIGLHFLTAGENTVGSAADNAVVLAKGPAHIGTLTMAEDGRVKAVFEPGLGVKVNGEEVLASNLKDDSHGPSDVVTTGTLAILVIDRGGKKALRVKDSEAERRTGFLGIDYFPIDPGWRIEADWVAFEKPREVPIHNIIGNVSSAMILGKAVFTREGHTIELLPIQDDPEGVLFFVISDRTSGLETYGAARFLYAAPPVAGKVLLDFNKAQNPPCAFTPYATCPLPPKENQLPIAVNAGEKKYRGRTD
ncbi:MAG: hypothetical protein JWM88_739 [Verrucomicrobia bacterium]|nr:hypothetical protein [Verrucomicrobiota bacterium]